MRNLRTILQLISDSGVTSRAEIARSTGLTRASVSSLVGELLDEGLVEVVGQGESVGGKPPTLIQINPNGGLVATIDAGEGDITGAVVDLTGAVVERVRVDRSDDLVEALLITADRLAERAGDKLLGVGVAIAGVIADDGTVVEAANLGLRNVPLARALEDRVDVPVYVLNDSHAAAMGAQRHDDEPHQDVLLLNIGNGLGAGIVLDGALHLGSHRAAGEIGHVVVDEQGASCRCGNRGCLETVASIPAIHRAATGRDVVDPAWDGTLDLSDADHRQILKEIEHAGAAIGPVLASIVNALDLTRIVITARPEALAEQLSAAIEVHLVPRLLPTLRSDLEVTADTDRDLGLRGVSALVVAEELGLALS